MIRRSQALVTPVRLGVSLAILLAPQISSAPFITTAGIAWAQSAVEGLPKVDPPDDSDKLTEQQKFEMTRDLYLTVVQISRQSPEQQRAKLDYLYNDLYDALTHLPDLGINWGGVDPKRPNETPEAYVERIKGQGYPHKNLTNEIGTLRAELLAKQVTGVTPLVKKDLHSPDRKRKLQGVALAAEVEMPALYEDLMTLYLAKGEPNDVTGYEIQYLAPRALTRLHDPRTLERLAPLFEADLPRESSFEILTELTGTLAMPIPERVIQILDTKKASLRHQMFFALMTSKDPKLLPYIRKFLADTKSPERGLAAEAALSQTGTTYKQLLPLVRALLKDPNRSVRRRVAALLAEREDPAAGPVLLEWLRNQTPEEANRGDVTQSIYRLTGSDFGYTTGTAGRSPATVESLRNPKNEEAIARFAAWIRAHPTPTDEKDQTK
jgi:hypothetical protein